MDNNHIHASGKHVPCWSSHGVGHEQEHDWKFLGNSVFLENRAINHEGGYGNCACPCVDYKYLQDHVG